MMTEGNVLIHHGIKGQKWGVRRFQNEDGSRTSAGLARDRKTYSERNDNDYDDSSERRGLSEGQKNALKTVGKGLLELWKKLPKEDFRTSKKRIVIKKKWREYGKADENMSDEFLVHHGIKGQRWGIRRFQNADGTRTALGKKHEKTLDSYDSESNDKSNAKQEYKQAKKAYNKSFNDYYARSHQAYSLSKKKRDANMDRLEKALDDADKLNKAEKQYKTERKEVRAESKQNAKDIRKNMSVGKKVATTVLGGPLGSVNFANYKAAGYSDKKALGKTYIDGILTGGLSTGHSTRVRNKAAEREHFN